MLFRSARTGLRSLALLAALAGLFACEETPPPAAPEGAAGRRGPSVEHSGVTGCTPIDQPSEDGLLVSYEHRFEGAGGEHWKLLVKPDGELSLFEWETAKPGPDGSVQVTCHPDAAPAVLRVEATALSKLRGLLENPRLKNLDTRYVGPQTGEYTVFRLTIHRGDDAQVIDAGPVDWGNLPKELSDVVGEVRALRGKVRPEG